MNILHDLSLLKLFRHTDLQQIRHSGMLTHYHLVSQYIYIAAETSSDSVVLPQIKGPQTQTQPPNRKTQHPNQIRSFGAHMFNLHVLCL